jgi:hypothetical protein
MTSLLARDSFKAPLLSYCSEARCNIAFTTLEVLGEFLATLYMPVNLLLLVIPDGTVSKTSSDPQIHRAY